MSIDVLSEVLEALGLEGTLEEEGPLAPAMIGEGLNPNGEPKPGERRFVFVLEGEGLLELSASGDVFDARPGDFLLFTPGEPLCIREGGIRVLKGRFRFRTPFEHPFVRRLPRFLWWSEGARSGAPAAPRELLSRIKSEWQATRPGGRLVLERLLPVLFVDLLRSLGAIPEGPKGGFPAPLRDRILAQALAALHEEPAAAWTIEALARRAAVSRSGLGERFRRGLGVAPMSYLTHWRMTLARRLLEGSELPIGRVAERVGYGSEAAFSRAFRRIEGTTPGRVRRAAARPGLHRP